MVARRAVEPPEIVGFDYLKMLGSGGTADVYLYRQRLPARDVAVKAILPDMGGLGDAAEGFVREANLLASLSTHPSIVTIFQAGMSRDGRGLIVMEYCPTSLGERMRKRPLSEEEALRTGVQLAGAIASAHRNGILHLDIKPSNVLVTAYGRPALTDFGTAGFGGDALVGYSIPWAAPELFDDEPRLSPLMDIYSLGATLFSLIAGRTPFEVPGRSNSASDLIERISRSEITPIERDDLSPRLVGVLRRAMSRDPEERYPDALSLGRALQRVQIDLSHAVTPLEYVETERHLDGELELAGEPEQTMPHEHTPRPSLLPVPPPPAGETPPVVWPELDEQTIIARRVVPSPQDLGLTPRPLTHIDSPFEVIVDELATQRPFARHVDYSTLMFVHRPMGGPERNRKDGDRSV